MSAHEEPLVDARLELRAVTPQDTGTAPAQKDERPGGAAFTPSLPDMSAGPSTLAGHPDERRRVLVVEDDRDAATLLDMALSELGYSVRVAHDGPAALQLARSFQPNTALIDIGLPGMDGLELARRLRAAEDAPRALWLVALTGYGRDSDRFRSREAGFDLHLEKPIAFDALSEAVAGDSLARTDEGPALE